MGKLAAVSHDCRPFLRLRAEDIARETAEYHHIYKDADLSVDFYKAVMMRQLADDISPGGYVQDAYNALHSHETRVLRDLGSALTKGAHTDYLKLLLAAIDGVRSEIGKIDVETDKRRVR